MEISVAKEKWNLFEYSKVIEAYFHASPNLNSKFSSSNKIANSPFIKKKLLRFNET